MFTAVYLAIAALVLVAAYFIFRRVGRDYREHGELTPSTATLQVAIFVAYACLVQAGYVGTDWPRLHDTGLPFMLGVLCMASGLVTVVAAVGVFGVRRMVGREVNVLKQSGTYRWSRNPQLVGGWLFMLGFTLLWSMWYVYAVVLVVVYAAMGHMMVLTEEEHLRRVFGEEYVRYCERVPRYIGFPKREP